MRPWIVQAYPCPYQVVADIGVSILYRLARKLAECSDTLIEGQCPMSCYDASELMFPRL